MKGLKIFLSTCLLVLANLSGGEAKQPVNKSVDIEYEFEDVATVNPQSPKPTQTVPSISAPQIPRPAAPSSAPAWGIPPISIPTTITRPVWGSHRMGLAPQVINPLNGFPMVSEQSSTLEASRSSTSNVVKKHKRPKVMPITLKTGTEPECIVCAQVLPECDCAESSRCFFVPQNCFECAHYICQSGNTPCAKCPAKFPPCNCNPKQSCIIELRTCKTCPRARCVD